MCQFVTPKAGDETSQIINNLIQIINVTELLHLYHRYNIKYRRRRETTLCLFIQTATNATHLNLHEHQANVDIYDAVNASSKA